MGQVIKVDDGPQLDGFLELVSRGVIGGEHDLLSCDPGGFGNQELRQAAAVGAGTFLSQDLHDAGVGGGLHGEVLTEFRRPGKGLLQAADIFPDALFIIEMEGRGIILDNLFKSFLGKGKILLCHGQFLLAVCNLVN